MIRILIADDSILVRAVLRDALNSSGDMTVVGEAVNGAEAVSLSKALKPDIIIMDILMPLMDGLEATETIMAHNPTPILILSSTVNEKDIKHAFTAIKKGALDVMEKPSINGTGNQADFFARLQEKIHLLVRIKVIHHLQRTDRLKSAPPAKASTRSILAIGASTGGPKAVMSIIKTLPRDFSGAVFIVQHISSGFARGFAHWLDLESHIRVRLAETGDVPTTGTALVAPTDCQMILEKGAVKIIDAPAVNCCRPSIDVFFESLAPPRGGDTVGLLLTGMGRDGARGLLRLKESGAFTIAQNEESCAVFGMPKAAIALNAADEVLPLETIPETVIKIFQR
jgi:two-component system chemotaxis response regulator CheB